MKVRRHEKEEVMSKLRDKVASGRSLFVAACGTGLVARMLEKAGADFICTFPGARLRSNGFGTMAIFWPMLDSNGDLFEYTSQDILPAINGDACVLTCINGNDLLRDMVVFLEKLKSIGVMAVSHAPSIGFYEKDTEMCRVLTKAGITLDREIEMLPLAKEMDFITFGQPFNIEDTHKIMEQAQPDAFMFHAGTTKGGLMGFYTPDTIEDTARRSEEAFKVALQYNPDVLLFAHGAAMETPEDAQYILDHTSCQGVWTGSSTERIPIENAILEIAGKFANLRVKN
jgi:predicted TIM-barrel enzyme